MEEEKKGTVFIRTKKERDYTVIDNTFLRDDRLSAQAKGIFAYILYLPEDWCIYQSELVKHFSNGKDSIRSAIKELESFGYISKEHIKGEHGKFVGWQYTVNEIPIPPKAENPKLVFPKLENPPLPNTDNISNTNNTKFSPIRSEIEPFPEYTPNVVKKTQRPKKLTKTEQTEQYLYSLSNEVYSKSHNCAEKLVYYLIKLQNSTTAAANLKSWQRDFAKFAEAENKSFDEIIKVIDFVFNDDWWSSRVSSASMIINNYGKLYQRMNGASKSNKKQGLGSVNYGNENYSENY